MTNQNQIICPKCNTIIDINSVLSSEIEKKAEARLRIEFEQSKKDLLLRYKTAEEKQNLEKEKIEKEFTALRQKEQEIQRTIASQVDLELKKSKENQTAEIKKNLQATYDDMILLLKNQNEEATKELKSAKIKELHFEKQKRDFELQKEQMKIENEISLNKMISEELTKIKGQEENAMKLKMAEKDHQIEQIRRQLEEATRKAEQGSMQIQGEVQEQALENELAALFPMDEIIEVPKGVRGADCIQKVKNNQGVTVGSIIFESKRTKDFSNEWIDKLKQDRITAQADLAVIITRSMPKGTKDIARMEGVWICTYTVYKGIVMSLRDGILRVAEATASQSNKGDKMQMLYDYLTSSEFKHQLEAIMEGFEQMKISITKEQIIMHKIWKEREKQIEKVLLNTAGFYGSVKGIAGNAIPSIPLLEPELSDDPED